MQRMCWLKLFLLSAFLFHFQMCISPFVHSILINTRKSSTHSFIEPSNLYLISWVINLYSVIFMFFFSPHPKREGKKRVDHEMRSWRMIFLLSASDSLRILGYLGEMLKWINLRYSCMSSISITSTWSKFDVQLTECQYLSRTLLLQSLRRINHNL